MRIDTGQVAVVTGGTSGIYGISKPEFGGRAYNTPAEYFWLLAPVVVLAIALAQKLTHSRIGRALGAVNDSEVAAECLGVDTSGLRLRVFVLAAGYAGLAGVFYNIFRRNSPTAEYQHTNPPVVTAAPR